ncbi:S8 family serine peptidase [bacterium]|nr:S8 family serine peptidase [bacterium]
MFAISLNKNIKRSIFYSIALFSVAILFLFVPSSGDCQFFSGWPAATANFSGYWPAAPSVFGSSAFGYGLFGQSITSSTGGQGFYPGLFTSSPVNTNSSWNFTGGYSYPTPQTGQNVSAGISFSPFSSVGFTQPFSNTASFGWGYPVTSAPVQYAGYSSPSSQYLGGIQAGSFYRAPTGYQNYGQYTSTPFSGGYSGYPGFSSTLWNWPQASSSGTVNYPSQSSSQTSGDESDIAVMPPVDQNYGDENQYVSGQILVKFHEGVSSDKQKMIHDSHKCKELYSSDYAGFKVIEIPSDKTVHEMVNIYIQEPEVLYAEPNYIRHSHFIPNDVYFKYQWHHQMLRSTSAWDLEKGAGVKVAVLDSGVAYRTYGVYTKAPDLAGTYLSAGWDFVNSDPYPDDDNGHGTHMAGCIAQTTNNYTGVAGVAHSATILIVKVMDADGSVGIANEADGIYYAANNGADIINLSIGGVGTSETESAAVRYAVNMGVVVICSAGNSASSTLEYPASYPESISVSAVRYDKTLARYSNYGAQIDICAPGGDIKVDQNYDYYGDGILQQTHDGTNLSSFYYYFMEGTSPAAALVSGAAALVIGKSSSVLTPQQVKTILESSATDLGSLGWDQYYGSGLVNAYNALLYTP